MRPNVVILVDNSESMTVADPKLPSSRTRHEAPAAGVGTGEVGGMKRFERVNAMLNHAKALTELNKKFNVHVYTFAGKPHNVNLPADPKKRNAYQFALAPETKEGDSTQIGVALQQPPADFSGQAVAGALVISDGGNNEGIDPSLAADATRHASIPVSTMGFGDPTQTKDVALVSVLADDVVRTNNTVSVYAALTHRGYTGKTVSVTLQRGAEVIGRESVKLGANGEKQEVHFNYVPTKAGRFYYTVSVSPQPGEITLANNKRTFPAGCNQQETQGAVRGE